MSPSRYAGVNYSFATAPHQSLHATENNSTTMTKSDMPTPSGTWAETRLAATPVRDDDDPVARKFVSKFSNNNVDSATIGAMSRSADAEMMMHLPSSKIWIVPMVAMTFETFFAMRFMCTSLQEFMEMITLGSINEVRQVYSTLSARMDEHINMVMYGADVEYRNMFVHTHPSKFMISTSNPEMEAMVSLFELMKARMNEYMCRVAKRESITVI